MGWGPGLTTKIDNGYGIVKEIVIGSADIDARSLTTTGGPIRGLRVLAGGGVLAYVDDATGQPAKFGDQAAVAPGDEFDPVAIRTINGTGNAVPSAALTLRVRV